MTEYVVHFEKNVANPGRRVRAIRVEAIDEMAAKAIAFREFSDRTYKIVRVEQVEG